MKNIFVVAMLGVIVFSGAVPVFAETSRPLGFRVCMQNAVTARDESIIKAVTLHSETLLLALKTRKASLVEAWGNPDPVASELARKDAWRAFQEKTTSAKDQLRASREDAWTKFGIDRRACGAPLTDTSNSDAGL